MKRSSSREVIKKEINPNRRRRNISVDQEGEKQKETDEHSDSDGIVGFESSLSSFTDTEAAIRYVRNILISSNEKKRNNLNVARFPPIVFVHQLYDIIKNKTVVNRQIEALRNEKKIVVIHLGNEECMKIAVFFNDLKSHVLEKCEVSEKILLRKFFDQVLATTVDIGISRANLIVKFRFSEKDIRFLVNAGLLILRDTGVLWFSFPSAGVFMKKLVKGRQLLLNCIKKKKYREVLEFELRKLPVSKSLELPTMYHVHDLIGGGFVNCVQTSSGRLLRIMDS